jgi:outer membrane protein OmpA-like peptidoglycan-associated protein
LVDLLQVNPTIVVELDGHSDGSENNAQSLSEQRVKKVYDLMIQKGIDRDRLVCKAWGAKKPLERDDDLDGKSDGFYKGAPNRVVILKVLRKDYGLPENKLFAPAKTESGDGQ